MRGRQNETWENVNMTKQAFWREGRALSTHKTQQSYEGYAKRTAKRMLSATRKRHAHRLANETATGVQNTAPAGVQNENLRNAKTT